MAFMQLADDDSGFRYTEAEAAMIGKLAMIKVAADGGNRKAKVKVAAVLKQLKALKKRAKKGDAKAARAAQVLEESGLLAPSQTFAMEGAEALAPNSGASWNPWNWRIGNVNATNVGLLAISFLLAWKRKWAWAAIPAVVVGLHEAKQKGWI